MKKGISILLLPLMIAAMLHISIAIHYCGSRIAATKVSLTQTLAHCCMESCEKEFSLSGSAISNHCCDDFVAFSQIDAKYSASYYYFPDYFQCNFQILGFPTETAFYSSAFLSSGYVSESPPGVLMSTHVDLSGICVFRI
jgi:hypothetical protein